jgi:uncharacterized protein YceK
MKRTRTSDVALALAVTAMAAGCAPLVSRVDCAAGQYYGLDARGEMFPTTPRVDCDFGDAVNMAVARQIMDKDAAVKNAKKDVAGLDGIAAREAMVRYQKSFRTPEPTPNVFSIGLTGGSNSTGQ